MSKREELERLPEPMESMLESWPVPERDDDFWEESAKAIEARLDGAKAEAEAHAALLDAPLPESDEDEVAAPSSEPPVSEAPPKSLLELARGLQAEEAKSDASDIAKESLSLARASVPDIEGIARASAPPPPRDSVAPPSQAAAPSQAPSQAAPVVDLERARAERSSTGPLLMAIVAVVGLAAAAIIVVRARSQAEAPVAMAPAAATATALASATPTATAEKVAANDPDIFSIEDLAGKKATGAGAPPALGKGSEGAPQTSRAGATEAPAATAEAKPAEAPKVEAKKEKDEPDLKLKPAATASDVPDKPSTGAVQAAIGQVLGGARACVAGQDGPSRATVTFGSDGRVQSVSVSGPAAGTPSEACIRAALSKARVQPFARPTFSVGATVRP